MDQRAVIYSSKLDLSIVFGLFLSSLHFHLWFRRNTQLLIETRKIDRQMEKEEKHKHNLIFFKSKKAM